MKKTIKKTKGNIEIFILISLIIFTGGSTSYFNYQKFNNQKTYNNFIKQMDNAFDKWESRKRFSIFKA